VVDPSSVLNVLSIPAAVVRWIGARLGFTNEPNLVLRDWKTAEVASDPRPAWYHWLHVRCVNEQRKGRSRWLTTQTAERCHAVVQFIREGDVFWWDDVPFAGRIDPSDDFDLVVDDDRAFIPLFIELDHEVPDPRGPATSLPPGVYPTGKKFFAGLTEPLPEGTYAVAVVVLRGKRPLVTSTWNGVIVIGLGGRPLHRSLPALPPTYMPPARVVPPKDMDGPFVLVDYVVDFKRDPQKKTRGLLLRNSGDGPAFNVAVSAIRAPTGNSASFQVLPILFADAPQEVLAEVEGMGPVFAHNLAEVLHDHYEATRTVHGFKVLFQPISIPLTVTYENGQGRAFRSEHVIEYVPGHQTAKARFLKREAVVSAQRLPPVVTQDR